jgi:hypothetical protein
MGKFDPSEREKTMVFELLPAVKRDIIEALIARGWTESYARSLIWNMRRVGQLYTNNGMIKKV